MRPARSKLIVYVILGVGFAGTCLFVAFAVAVARALDTDRELSDFADQGEARAFTSAHLPAPLPRGAVVESLLYQRWTDWNLTARVRLPSAEVAGRYVEEARRQRKVDDARCSPDEPADGARYFLADVSACGSMKLTSPQILEVQCNTR